jgi:hypothetical protein
VPVLAIVAPLATSTLDVGVVSFRLHLVRN